jgi:hypothetical protein
MFRCAYVENCVVFCARAVTRTVPRTLGFVGVLWRLDASRASPPIKGLSIHPFLAGELFAHFQYRI